MDQNKVPVIKSEPGTSSTYKRLPSFKSPRDLKLSDFQKSKLPSVSGSKKVYVPNLNIQRKKPTEETSKPTASEKPSPKNDEKVKKEKRKKAANYIQSSGVFSEGLAPSIKTGRWTSRYSESSESSMMHIPRVGKSKDAIKVDKHDEETMIKELLRDDFIDDPSIEPDLKQCPIQLPLQMPIKDEPKENPSETNDVKPRSLTEMTPLTIQQLIQRSTDHSFIFFQLPHVLPTERLYVPTGTKENQPSGSNSQSEPAERNVLRKLPAGKIGKLQIMKSGKAKLVLGNVKFHVEPGTQPSFRQDLMTFDLNSISRTGDMINLGNITSHMIISPDWHQLLTSS